MAAISSNTLSGQHPYTGSQIHKYERNKSITESLVEPKPQDLKLTTDTVEISDEARDLLASNTDEKLKIVTGLGRKALEPGSEEEAAFKDLLASVKSNKSKLNTELEDILKKAGLNPAKLGKFRLEVDSSGKILVGGLDDKDLTKRIQKALNDDKSIGKKLKQYQMDEKELSRQMKEYTGCSLYELTQASKGDANERIREAVSKSGIEADADYFMNLDFLNGALYDVMNLDDVKGLTFGGIDFSAEVSVLSKPEETIKESMAKVVAGAKAAFEAINEDFLATLEAGGYPMEKVDDEFRDTYLLDITRASFSVDSNGGIKIDGMFAGDMRTHNKGEEILRDLIAGMLTETDDNSYHMNLFKEAGKTLLDNMEEELGMELASDAAMVAQVNHGEIGDVFVTSPKTEELIQNQVQDTVNQMLEAEGVMLSSPVEIEVDEEGRIHAVNLREGTEEAAAVQNLIERMNLELDVQRKVDRKKDTDEEEDEVKILGQEEDEEETKQLAPFTWESGLQEVLDLTDKLQTLRKG